MNIFTKTINALRRRGVLSHLTEDFAMKTLNSNGKTGGVISHTEYITSYLKSAILNSILAVCLSMFAMSAFAENESNGCPPQKIGHIHVGSSSAQNVVDLLDGISKWFPVDLPATGLYDHRARVNNIGEDGIDAVVDELEDIVNDMKSLGIKKIMMQLGSPETAPFIEGSAGSLGGVHSDIRHPDVTFAANRQGTSSVDNAQNWYRTGIDFKTTGILTIPVVLPDVTGIIPQPQFIVGTDESLAVEQFVDNYVNGATTAGYAVIVINMGWTGTGFNNLNALGAAIDAAPLESRVGLAVTFGGGFERLVALTIEGNAHPKIFDPLNFDVTYLNISWVPFGGSGVIPVDLIYGIVAQNELTNDPDGVNKYLLRLGFPDDADDAQVHNVDVYGSNGISMAPAMPWFASCERKNLDKRYKLDENRQKVHYFITDRFLPAKKEFFETVQTDQRVNPRWLALP